MLRAISVWEPWCTGMMRGKLDVNTRSFNTHFRGEIAIHASLKHSNTNLAILAAMPEWQEVLQLHEGTVKALKEACHFGHVVAVGYLAECAADSDQLERYARRTITALDRKLDDYSAGRFLMLFRNIKPLNIPLPLPGKRGVWTLDLDIEARIRSRL